MSLRSFGRALLLATALEAPAAIDVALVLVEGQSYRDAAELIELGGHGIEVESAGDENVEVGVAVAPGALGDRAQPAIQLAVAGAGLADQHAMLEAARLGDLARVEERQDVRVGELGQDAEQEQQAAVGDARQTWPEPPLADPR